jgi:hypothetical protein
MLPLTVLVYDGGSGVAVGSNVIFGVGEGIKTGVG